MAKSAVNTQVIIKKVSKHLSDSDIKTELKKSSRNCYTDPIIKRFIKRTGEVLNTVSFKNHVDYIKATSVGIFLFGEHFNVEPFVQKPSAHQCYRCKNFGHPAK